MPPKESDKHEYDDHEFVEIGEDGNEIKNRVNNSHSEHEEFLHPNMISEPDDETRKSQMTKS